MRVLFPSSLLIFFMPGFTALLPLRSWLRDGHHILLLLDILLSVAFWDALWLRGGHHILLPGIRLPVAFGHSLFFFTPGFTALLPLRS